jgi:uncharacterized membrane protein
MNLDNQLERSMLLKRITLGTLIFTLLGSIFALCVLGFKIPWAIPLTPILTFSSFIFSILHSSQIEGWIKTLFFVVLVVAAGLFFESLGVATGLVYGPYHYSDALGPKFLGLVPYLIPIAWTFMMYPSMVIAKALTPTRWNLFQRGITIAALSGVIMTAWDVMMDPMMVQGGNWVWDVKGAYFGVPLQNFWGWWLTTFVAVGLFLLITRKMAVKIPLIPDRWAVWMYVMTGATSFATCLIVNLHGPALAGLFAMLPWMVMGLLKTSKEEKGI